MKMALGSQNHTYKVNGQHYYEIAWSESTALLIAPTNASTQARYGRSGCTYTQMAAGNMTKIDQK